MKVKLTDGVYVRGTPVDAGIIVEIPDEDALALIAGNKGEAIDPRDIPRARADSMQRVCTLLRRHEAWPLRR